MNLEHLPESYSTCISRDDVTERALQRAIIGLKTATLDDGTVTWIDIELPIKEGKTNRFDLIGEAPDGNYVLCELKFANNQSSGDNPEGATTQVLSYRDALLDYAKRLENANQRFNLHENATMRQLDIERLINQPLKLIIAANKEYWDKHTCFTKNPAVDYYSINIDSEWFVGDSRKQSAESGEYTPSMPPFTRRWTRV